MISPKIEIRCKSCGHLIITISPDTSGTMEYFCKKCHKTYTVILHPELVKVVTGA